VIGDIGVSYIVGYIFPEKEKGVEEPSALDFNMFYFYYSHLFV